MKTTDTHTDNHWQALTTVENEQTSTKRKKIRRRHPWRPPFEGLFTAVRTLTLVKGEELLAKLRKARVGSYLYKVPVSPPFASHKMVGSVRCQVSLQPPAPPYCRASPSCCWLSENIRRPAACRGAGAEKAGGPAPTPLRNKLNSTRSLHKSFSPPTNFGKDGK